MIALLTRTRHQAGFRIGPIGFGFFPGFAGRGWISIMRGLQCIQIRVWRFVLAIRLPARPDTGFVWCWPAEKQVG